MGRIVFFIAFPIVMFLSISAGADWTSTASYPVVTGSDQSIIKHEWTSAATDSTAYDISSCTGSVEGRFDPSVSDSSTDATFQFRMCKTSTATSPYCRSISWPGPSNGSTWVGINALTSDENYIIADALTATAGGDTARVEVRCTSLESVRSDAGGALVQASPSTTAEADRLTAQITKPANVEFGFGVATESDPPAFVAKTYPGSATDGSENNNMMGFFYNKAGVYSSTIPNMFEHAFDFSIENAYRSTGGTSDETWTEWNWDFYPPDISSPTTSSTTTGWVDGDYLSFSGGGSGRLKSVSGSDPTKTILWRHDFGTTSSGETVTNISRSSTTAVLGTLTPDPQRLINTSSGGKSLRPFLFTYRTLTNTSTFDFYTGYGASPNFSIGAGIVRYNSQPIIAGTGTAVYGPATWAISNGGTFDTGTEVCAQINLTCQDVLEFSVPATPTDSTCAATNANTVKFLAMCY